MGFFLYVLVNAVLFIRPSEIIPDLAAVPIFNILITSCLLASFGAVLRELGRQRLVETPISMCVVGMLGAVVLSHASHYNLTYVKDFGIEFLKIVLYYLLLVALLDSPQRLRRFLGWLVGLIGVITVMSLLHYHGVVTIPGMKVEERLEVNSATGEAYTVLQLYGTGIFADPNDLCLILIMGVGLSLYKLGDRASVLRCFWGLMVVVFGYTLFLTKSRGGFVGMLACVLTIFIGRFGWKKAIPIAAVTLPLMVFLFGGRQTDLSASSGTGQTRSQIWAEALLIFRRVPLFGLGSGLLPDEIGIEAHNSYVSAYAELGFFGGTLFLGSYACAFLGLHRLGHYIDQVRDPGLRRMRPYVLGITVGYAAGILTITRNYINPTYLVPGLVAVYLRMAAADALWPLPLPRFDARLVNRLIAASACTVVFFYLYTRLFARFG